MQSSRFFRIPQANHSRFVLQYKQMPEIIVFLGICVIWFAIYSFLGWVIETASCSIMAKRFINRGFLNGPYCPIYGVGAIPAIFILSQIDNVFLLFICGAVMVSAIEYFASWAMEKRFNARWWDYSHIRFNLNGRICLGSGLLLGAVMVFGMKCIHPHVVNFTSGLSGGAIVIIAAAFIVLFVTDFFLTMKYSERTKAKVKDFANLNPPLFEDFKKTAFYNQLQNFSFASFQANFQNPSPPTASSMDHSSPKPPRRKKSSPKKTSKTK